MKQKLLFCMSCVLYFISSAMIFAIAFLRNSQNSKIFIILGACFWGFLILGIILHILFIKAITQDTKVPFNIFAINIPAMIAGSTFVVSLLASILIALLKIHSVFWQTITFFLTLYCFELYFLLNSHSFNKFTNYNLISRGKSSI